MRYKANPFGSNKERFCHPIFSVTSNENNMVMTEQQIREFELRQAVGNSISATKRSRDKMLKKLSKPPSVLLKEERLQKLKLAGANADLKPDVFHTPIAVKENTSCLKDNNTNVVVLD